MEFCSIIGLCILQAVSKSNLSLSRVFSPKQNRNEKKEEFRQSITQEFFLSIPTLLLILGSPLALKSSKQDLIYSLFKPVTRDLKSYDNAT